MNWDICIEGVNAENLRCVGIRCDFHRLIKNQSLRLSGALFLLQCFMAIKTTQYFSHAAATIFCYRTLTKTLFTSTVLQRNLAKGMCSS